MAREREISKAERVTIDSLTSFYRDNYYDQATRLAEALFSLLSDSQLRPYVHSLKRRAKDPAHLRDKLTRKLEEAVAKNEQFDITNVNLFEKINDLAGVRILHLHTSQFPKINEILLNLLEKEDYKLLEGPIARIWDDEYKNIFKSYGIESQHNPRLYTSVHYVVGTGTKNLRTAEIQVRTLAEELWGEVDHTINYPHASVVRSCQEQIKVLARITSSCTRLVDSIFLTKHEAGDLPKKT